MVRFLISFALLLFFDKIYSQGRITSKDSILVQFSNNTKLCQSEDKYGLLEKNDYVHLNKHKLKWDAVFTFSSLPDYYAIVDSASFWGLIEKKTGKLISNTNWNYIDSFVNNISIIGKIKPELSKIVVKGLMNNEGKVIIEPSSYIKRLNNNDFIVRNLITQSIQILNSSGEIKNEISGYSLYTYPVQKKEKREIITIDSTVAAFDDYSMLVTKNNELGILDKNEIFTSIPYIVIGSKHFTNDVFSYIFLVKKQDDNKYDRKPKTDKYMLIHCRTGKQYIFDDFQALEPNLLMFTKKGRYGIINDSGMVLSNDYLGFKQIKNKSYTAIDKDTNLIFFSNDLVPFQKISKITNLFPSKENLNIITTVKQKDGIVDDKGNILVSPIYTSINSFDNLIIVRNDENKAGVININNKIIIPMNYVTVIPLFSSTTEQKNPQNFIVHNGDSQAIFNKQGDNITGFKFQEFMSFTPSLLLFKEKNKWGLIQSNGKILIPAKWQDIKKEYCFDFYAYRLQIQDKPEEVDIYLNGFGKEVKTNNPCTDIGLKQSMMPEINNSSSSPPPAPMPVGKN